MNLSSIYGYLEYADRCIIIHAMDFYKASITRGMKIKDWKVPLHNKIWALDAFVVRKALCHDLNGYSSSENNKNDHVNFRVKRLNRMIKLIDDIL